MQISVYPHTPRFEPEWFFKFRVGELCLWHENRGKRIHLKWSQWNEVTLSDDTDEIEFTRPGRGWTVGFQTMKPHDGDRVHYYASDFYGSRVEVEPAPVTPEYARAEAGIRAALDTDYPMEAVSPGGTEKLRDPHIPDLVRLVLRPETPTEAEVDEVYRRWFGEAYGSGHEALAQKLQQLHADLTRTD